MLPLLSIISNFPKAQFLVNLFAMNTAYYKNVQKHTSADSKEIVKNSIICDFRKNAKIWYSCEMALCPDGIQVFFTHFNFKVVTIST